MRAINFQRVLIAYTAKCLANSILELIDNAKPVTVHSLCETNVDFMCKNRCQLLNNVPILFGKYKNPILKIKKIENTSMCLNRFIISVRM